MSKWREYKLEDIADMNCSNLGKNYPFEDIQYLDTGSITQNKLEGYQYFKIKDAPSRAKRLVKNYDLIYSTVRPIQRHFGFIVNPCPNLVVSTGFAVITTKKGKAAPKYLYYFLSNNEIVDYLDSIAEGSTSAYPSLRPADISQLDITLPSLPEQEAIAEVLSSLDDKIDLLHRQNKALEQLAETLFRRIYGEGFDETNLGNEFNIVMGQSPPGTSYNEVKNGIVFYQGRTEFDFRFPTQRVYCTLPTRFAHKFDTLLSVRAPVGDLNITTEKCSIGRGVAALRHKNDQLHYSYTYYCIKYLKESFNTHEDSGTVFGSINKNDLLNIKCPKFNNKSVQQYNTRIGLLDDKIYINYLQIQTLQTLRDTLLPKLMSGAVRVQYE